MRALITGASSGMGRDMAKYLSKLGYDLVLVARRKELLEEVKKDISTNCEIEVMDVSKVENCKKLFEKYRTVELLINNAGFGLFGEFWTTDIDTGINMIDTNIKAVHVLTRLYVEEMQKRNNGKILNVGSIAGFMTGPLMSEYYATKNYVVELSSGINKELKKAKSNVSISVFCPGPVQTNFNNVANVKFATKGITSDYASKYAIDKFLEGKEIIIPGLSIKILYLLNKILPRNIMSEFAYNTQSSKRK
ncbi:MAG: SDR family NAD(P)-dependent oxidoreductase [Clostridia bacterium]|nr:SDR family NAD(P)-dependent oxidoreductase [Clostridia bacterium]